MTHAFETPQGIGRFGIARRDITPPVGIYHRMWGASVHDRSTGVHRPLTATAMTFRPAEEDDPEQVLVAVDHCLLRGPEMNRLLERIERDAGVARSRVVVTFSHTHAAGLMEAERRDLPGGDLIEPYLDEMNGKIAACVADARDHVQPVTILCATGRCTLAAQRDFYDEESAQWVCGTNPDGDVDDLVLAARVADERNRTVATLVGYGCHPTTLAWDNTQISPDFPGALRELVERATEAPCVFLLGACGDVGPREGFVGEPAVADRNGRQLGHAAASALESLPPPRTRFVYTGPVVSGATIGTWAHHQLFDEDLAALKLFRVKRFTVELPYRDGLSTRHELQEERAEWAAVERAAHEAGHAARAREARAMIERKDRALTRLRDLPEASAFPYPVSLWQLGQIVWITLEGEPYQRVQRELRRRFPNNPLFVCVLANGTRCSYLPPEELYGAGLYQESVAVLAPGCLERLIARIGEELDEWL